MGKDKRKNMFYIDCKIYPYEILVFFGKNKKPLSEELRKKIKGEDKWIKSVEDDTEGIGAFYISPSNKMVLWCEKFPVTIHDFGVMVHEIFHVTSRIMARVGISHNDATEEAYAYLNEYLYKEICRKMWCLDEK